MSSGDLLGYLFVAGLLGLVTASLFRARRSGFWMALTAGLLLLEMGLRLASHLWFPAENLYGFTHDLNPGTSGEEDLLWPNRVLMFLLTSLALWITFRPPRRSLTAAAGASLSVAGGWPNLLEPWLFGHTTDYLGLGPVALNLSDLCLVAGLPVLLVGVVLDEYRSEATVGDPMVASPENGKARRRTMDRSSR